MASWPFFLPSAFTHGYLEGHLIQPRLIVGETEVWREESACQRVSYVLDVLLECNPIFSQE